jgi:MFS family permease
MNSLTFTNQGNGLRTNREAAPLRLAPPSLAAVPLETTFVAIPDSNAQSVVADGPPRHRLSANAAFYLQASITVAFLAGSSAPSPLYPIYQAAWGFSSLAITVIFGIYAFAVLVALLIAGRISDHVGRRPVLLAATVVQAATMIVFATAGGLTSLLVARVIQGLSAGAAVAAVGAGLLDIDRSRGTIANSIVAPLGTATGGLIAGVMVQFLPAPTHLVYLVLGVIFILQGIGVYIMSETLTPRPGALASLKPQIRVPTHVRKAFLLALPALVATWALAGFYAALAPSLVRSVFGFASSLPAGLVLFAMAGSAGLAVLVLRHHEAKTVAVYGALALLVGTSITVTALTALSVPIFYFGTIVAGMGFGAGFQGAVRSVISHAKPDERAGVLSMIFIVSYVAMGLPAIIAGLFIGSHGDLRFTTEEFAGVVIVLAGLALLAALRKSATHPNAAAA